MTKLAGMGMVGREHAFDNMMTLWGGGLVSRCI
jgi:hypothetical protein